MTEDERVVGIYQALGVLADGPSDADRAQVFDQIERLTINDRVRLLPLCNSTGLTGERRAALRSAIEALVYRDLAVNVVETLDQSTAAATRLARIGIWLTVVVGLAGIAVSAALALT